MPVFIYSRSQTYWMPTKCPKPLKGDELRSLRDCFGSDRLARLLLWEIARLRSVVMVLYRQICRLSYHRPDEVGPGIDEETEAVLEDEPVILENARPASENYKYGRKRSWPHMTEQAETALAEKIDTEAKEKLTERELKRQSPEARSPQRAIAISPRAAQPTRGGRTVSFRLRSPKWENMSCFKPFRLVACVAMLGLISIPQQTRSKSHRILIVPVTLLSSQALLSSMRSTHLQITAV